MNWGELLLAVVMYCHGNAMPDVCRESRIACFKRVAASPVYKTDAVAGINQCLTNPTYEPPTAPVPAASPSPSPSPAPSPTPNDKK